MIPAGSEGLLCQFLHECFSNMWTGRPPRSPNLTTTDFQHHITEVTATVTEGVLVNSGVRLNIILKCVEQRMVLTLILTRVGVGIKEIPVSCY
jgi:hypothetical protein